MWKGSEDEKAWCLSEEGIQKRVTSGRKKLLKSKGMSQAVSAAFTASLWVC